MAPKHLAPFVPSANQPFDARLAAHLLRRAGFGAHPQAVEEAVKKGLEATVDELFEDKPEDEKKLDEVFESLADGLLNFNGIDACQTWWVYRMMKTKTPLREKMALFWHGHFATSNDKVNNPSLMMAQNSLFRKHGVGPFRELVHAICKDPAMLIYLDGEANTKEHPNENFARELMELFTCGIGNYGEKDVLESARAFTGWNRKENTFLFRPEAHDDGVKSILGKRGKFDGGDVVDILMTMPATGKFIAKKLLKFFACPEPADDVVEEAGESLHRSQLNLKWFLRELFQSNYFFSPACVRKRISSPVEFVVGTVRTLGAKLTAPEMAQACSNMGQRLFLPPNVKGWDGEQKWIHANSIQARSNFVRGLTQYQATGNGLGPNFDLNAVISLGLTDPDKATNRVAETLFQGEATPEQKSAWAKFLITTQEGPRPDQFRSDENTRNQKIRDLLASIMASPDYQIV